MNGNRYDTRIKTRKRADRRFLKRSFDYGKKMDKLTEIEKHFMSAMLVDEEAPTGFDENNPQHWPNLRTIMKKTAYHEAGHFAARCFTQLEFSHIHSISIIPNRETVGRMTSERPFMERSLEVYPPPLQRANGRALLLEMLAGVGSEILINHGGGYESILDYMEDEYYSNGEEDTTTDYSRALRIANIMAKPHMQAHRILNMAEKWTMEMLRIPTIWNIVETVAGELIEHGIIMREELYVMAHDLDSANTYKIPKWKKRLSCGPGELEKYTEHA